MRSQRIDQIRKRFHNRKEWLLFKVDTLDSATTTPVSGRLIAHSTNREKIFQRSISCKGLTFIDYSEDKLPAGYAVAF